MFCFAFLNICLQLNLMHFCFSGKYNSWDKVDPAELFSKAPTEKKEANPKLSMVKFLQVCFLMRCIWDASFSFVILLVYFLWSIFSSRIMLSLFFLCWTQSGEIYFYCSKKSEINEIILWFWKAIKNTTNFQKMV